MSRRSSGNSFGAELLVYGGFFLIVGFIALAVGCTDEKAATKALNNQGFTDVKMDGWGGPLVCDKWNATDFIAKNQKGETVTGTVCSGLLFKNATITW